MPDLLDRLKTALADRYAIEREIGAGGMLTVYLAEDLKHHRKVAISWPVTGSRILRRSRFSRLPVSRFIQGPAGSLLVLAISLMGGLVVGACGGDDAVAPDDASALFETLATAQAVAERALSSVEQNPAVLSLGVLSDAFAFGADPLSDLLGRTFVFDPQTAQYEFDDARAGAPQEGVRMLLYAVADGQVSTPLEEIGYVDLIPDIAPGDTAFTVRATVGGVTLLDYAASASRTPFFGTAKTFSLRNTSEAEGVVSSESSSATFEFTDIRNPPWADVVFDYQVTLLGRGEVLTMTGNIPGPAYDDADPHATVRIVFPGATGTTTVIEAEFNGIRCFGSPGVITLNGNTVVVDGYRDVAGDTLTSDALQSFWDFIAEPCGGLPRRMVDAVGALLAPTRFGVDVASITTGPFSWASVSAGGSHTCGITTDGDAYCWGQNLSGELGNGSIDVTRSEESFHPFPELVVGGLSFATLSAGYFGLTCAMTTDGELYCWGRGTPVPELTFGGQRFAMVSARAKDNLCGVTSSGAAYCGGDPVPGGLTFRSVSAGPGHVCGLTVDGAAYCWGLNGSGQLGDGSTVQSSLPVLVAGGLTFSGITTGFLFGFPFTCGVTLTGAAYCWGTNDRGQLGDGTVAASAVPVAVSGGFTFASASAGTTHTCGVTIEGDAYCWGSNGGQLGDGTRVDRIGPVLVSGGHTFASVSAGGGHTCGITTDGDAYCWGDNLNGQVGDPSSGSRRLSPVPVLGRR